MQLYIILIINMIIACAWHCNLLTVLKDERFAELAYNVSAKQFLFLI